MEQVTSLAIDANRGWRAHYGRFEDEEGSGLRVDTFVVFGWACLGDVVYPVRVEAETGRGVLVGSPLDPDRDALLAVLTPGEDWEALDGMDARVRAILHEGISRMNDTEADDAEEG